MRKSTLKKLRFFAPDCICIILTEWCLTVVKWEGVFQLLINYYHVIKKNNGNPLQSLKRKDCICIRKYYETLRKRIHSNLLNVIALNPRRRWLANVHFEKIFRLVTAGIQPRPHRWSHRYNVRTKSEGDVVRSPNQPKTMLRFCKKELFE